MRHVRPALVLALAGALSAQLKDREKLVAMGQKARTLARPEAVKDLVKLIFDLEVRR